MNVVVQTINASGSGREKLRSIALGVIEYLMGRALLDDFPFVEDHAVGDGSCKPHFMGHCDDGHAGLTSSIITSNTSLIISGSSAEVGSSNSMMRGCIARPGNRHTLPSAGELRGIFISLFWNAHTSEQLHRQFTRLLLRHSFDPGWRKRNILDDGQVRKQVELLKDHAHFLADLFHVANIIAKLDAIHNDAVPFDVPPGG